MIQIIDKSQCCGCTACASICTQNAITMQPDVMGFLYPVVDKGKCIDCSLCEKVCAFNDLYDISLNLKEPIVYAARHKNIHEIETSRSGAAFIALSDWILDSGGVVYGAGYADHFRVIHKKATTKEERDEFKGSKYVQSDMNTVFRQVKDDLKKGLLVLFTGTPCQTAGLNSYLGKKLRKNLFLVDIICHGVPSPYIWNDYLTYVENKYQSRIVKVDFRNKINGWSSAHIETFVFENGHVVDLFTLRHLFYKHIILRKSCGNCKYANFIRPSDITIGDFWGWEKTDKNFNKDDKGVSLVLLNTEQGQKIFFKCLNELNIISTTTELCVQPNLVTSSILDEQSDSFMHDYSKKGFLYVAKKYGNLGVNYKIDQFKKKIILRAKNILSQK